MEHQLTHPSRSQYGRPSSEFVDEGKFMETFASVLQHQQEINKLLESLQEKVFALVQTKELEPPKTSHANTSPSHLRVLSVPKKEPRALTSSQKRIIRKWASNDIFKDYANLSTQEEFCHYYTSLTNKFMQENPADDWDQEAVRQQLITYRRSLHTTQKRGQKRKLTEEDPPSESLQSRHNPGITPHQDASQEHEHQEPQGHQEHQEDQGHQGHQEDQEQEHEEHHEDEDEQEQEQEQEQEHEEHEGQHDDDDDDDDDDDPQEEEEEELHEHGHHGSVESEDRVHQLHSHQHRHDHSLQPRIRR